MTTAIQAQGLGRRFGDIVAVNELDLEIEAGTIFGVLGHNGAGKTTTVRLLNGVLAPSEGKVRVLGLSPMADGPMLRRRTGVLTETPSLEERLTGRENLLIFADLYDVPRHQVADRVQALLDTFQLADRADDKVAGYSKGMHQRLALARALLHQPEILFLDEPTAGLDPVATRQVHTLIQEMSHEDHHTVFLCTHNLNEAQRLCDQVAVLEQGRIIAQGSPRELARQLGHSVRLEIKVEQGQAQKAREILAETTRWPEPTIQQDLLIVTGADRAQIPDLIAALTRQNVRLYQITPREPSLEDVYFALHERKGHNAQP